MTFPMIYPLTPSEQRLDCEAFVVVDFDGGIDVMDVMDAMDEDAAVKGGGHVNYLLCLNLALVPCPALILKLMLAPPWAVIETATESVTMACSYS